MSSCNTSHSKLCTQVIFEYLNSLYNIIFRKQTSFNVDRSCEINTNYLELYFLTQEKRTCEEHTSFIVGCYDYKRNSSMKANYVGAKSRR